MDAPADVARNAAKSLQGDGRGAFGFAGLVVDLDASTLKRESGETIALTRGEFALLREFVRRPGRVLSRDLLLDAIAGRRNVPFDRSVDVMVGRLRKKVEPDPKQPTVIQTVAGEGYRFNAPISRCAPAAETIASTIAASPGDTAIPPPGSGPRTLRAFWPVLAAAVVLCLFATAAAIQWRSLPQEAAPRLSIVVLPFENLSADKEQDYFADGITEDLTTDLSRLPDSFIIARGTAFTYKGKPVEAKQIGKDLGVRYLLEGSARRVDEKITINAQLVSTETGAHVWADRFEGDRGRLGELQVEAVSRVANSLGVELIKAEALRGVRERAGNPDAVDLAMRGTAVLNGIESEGSLNKAIALFERALSLDERNVQALVGLSFALTSREQDFADDNAPADLLRAEQAVDAALTVQPENSSGHFAESLVYEAKHQWGLAVAAAQKAVFFDRNNAKALGEGGLYKMFLGRAEDGFADVEAALRLSPRDSFVAIWQFYICHFHSHLAQWEQAIEWCNKSVASGNETQWPYTDLAAAHGWLGQMTEAKEAAAKVLKYDPDFTIQGWMESPLHDHWNGAPAFKAQLERIVEGARKAGLPEGEKKAN